MIDLLNKEILYLCHLLDKKSAIVTHSIQDQAVLLAYTFKWLLHWPPSCFLDMTHTLPFSANSSTWNTHIASLRPTHSHTSSCRALLQCHLIRQAFPDTLPAPFVLFFHTTYCLLTLVCFIYLLAWLSPLSSITFNLLYFSFSRGNNKDIFEVYCVIPP